LPTASGFEHGSVDLYVFLNSFLSLSILKLGCIVSVVSSLFLIFWPIRLLWAVELPPKERRLILVLFASSIIMTAFGCAHMAYSYGLNNAWTTYLYAMTALLEVSILRLFIYLKQETHGYFNPDRSLRSNL
jgi:hypothetical protein